MLSFSYWKTSNNCCTYIFHFPFEGSHWINNIIKQQDVLPLKKYCQNTNCLYWEVFLLIEAINNYDMLAVGPLYFSGMPIDVESVYFDDKHWLMLHFSCKDMKGHIFCYSLQREKIGDLAQLAFVEMKRQKVSEQENTLKIAFRVLIPPLCVECTILYGSKNHFS